jgi:CheY-like chemotaxis protein
MKRIGTAVASPQPTKDASKPLILYVEDEDENWMVTELRLRDRYNLLRAADDHDACRIVRSYGASLYAILMDIQLKGSQLDGIKLTKLFKGKLDPSQVPLYAQGCPVVKAPIFFVTAYGARYTEEELKRIDGHALITKPVDFLRLTLALASANARSALTTLAGNS